MPSIEITGVDELNENIKKLIKSVEPDKVEPILLKASDKIASTIRALAPLGPTGNLKKSIVSKVLKRRSDTKSAPSMVAIDYRKGPHAHLVEFGHGGIHPAGPHPFFRPGWDSNKHQVEEDIKTSLLNAVDKAVP